MIISTKPGIFNSYLVQALEKDEKGELPMPKTGNCISALQKPNTNPGEATSLENSEKC